MKKNLYYRNVLQRRNKLKEAFLMFFWGIASYPRLILEVFLRKNMGCRYYSFSSCVTILVLLFIIPMMFGDTLRYGFFEHFKEHKLWYLFCITFIFYGYRRYKEVKRIEGEFDFQHFSLSTGLKYDFFYSLKFNGKTFTPRQIEIFIEPLPVLILGILLLLIDQVHLGLLFIVCSIIYSQSYAAAYMLSDHFILDKIDEIICNEGLNDTFVHDKPSEKGFEYNGIKPKTEAWRKKIYDQMFDEDEDVTSAV